MEKDMKEVDEIWRPIEGYEGSYEVSNLGRVRSLDRIDTRGWRHKGRICKQTKNKRGYLLVSLWWGNRGKNVLVHRLVASAFIPNPDGFPCVNHKDECPQNNRVENLEWCTLEYNIRYSMEKIIATSRATHCVPVVQLTKSGVEVARFNSVTEAQLATGVHGSLISNVIRGTILMNKNGRPTRRRTAGGFRWEVAR